MSAQVIDLALERRKRDARRLAELGPLAFVILFVFVLVQWPPLR